MGEPRWLEKNLAALAARQAPLAASIRAAAPDARLVPLSSRSGLAVPGVRSESGTAPLHSLYDPRQEAARLAESVSGAGLLVVCGLGGGFHIEAMLEDSAVHAVIVVEKDSAVLRFLLAQASLVPLLEDPRVLLVAGLESIREAVLAVWQPAFMGGLRVVSLRPWHDREARFFDSAVEEVHAATELVRGDYSVQSHFGKRWFTNILMNLRSAEASPPAYRSGMADAATAAVTAAGPSLELHLPRLAAEREKLYLLATDTSLPALLQSGIRPDAVLSIDCQNHGYHHFLQGIPDGTSLFLDLASPPLLARRRAPTVFVASAHPFVQYVVSHWKALPAIDTSGGNVTHAAVSLADSFGARRIEVYGADFSYPAGKSYARGTYLYDYFRADQGRMTPAESRFFAFIRGAPPARREVHAGQVVYTTPLLEDYRERFMKLMGACHAVVVPAPGSGLDLHSQGIDPEGRIRADPEGRIRVDPEGRQPSAHGIAASSRGLPVFSTDAPRVGWKEFLSSYARGVGQLPAFSGDRSGLVRQLWGTLLPVAARVVKEGLQPGPAAMEEARRWSLERIHRILQPVD